MAVLFNCTFENGALYNPPPGNGAEVVVQSGPKLEVVAAAAHDGSYGLRVTPISGSTRLGMVGFYPLTKVAHKRIRQRFWLHPNGISISSGGEMRVARNLFTSFNLAAYAVWLGHNGTSYYIKFGICANSAYDDNFTAYSAALLITNAWHRIEFDWMAGAPGFMQLWIDGVDQGTIYATNDQVSVSCPGLGLGYPGATAITTTGAYLLDSWTANDTGETIGA